MKEKKISIVSLWSLIIFHACCITIYYGKFTNVFTIIALLLSLMIVITKIPQFLSKRNFKINIILLLFAMIGLVSSFIRKININTEKFFFGKLLILFLFVEYSIEKKKKKNVIKVFGILYFIYGFISVLLDIFNHSLYITASKNYLIGNKFAVSYAILMAIILLTITISSSKKPQIIKNLFLTIIYIIAISCCIYVDCNTGMLCCIIFIIWNNSKVNLKKLISGKKILIVSILSSAILMLFRSTLLNLPPIQYFIVNILNRSLTLSGRTVIYDHIFNIILQKPLLGYGFGNNYDILYNLIQAPNTQNALLEWWFNSGMVGLILLLFLIYYIFYNLSKYKLKNNYMKPLVIGEYIFLILGSIEITIGSAFFILLSLINVGNNNYKPNNIKGEIK